MFDHKMPGIVHFDHKAFAVVVRDKLRSLILHIVPFALPTAHYIVDLHDSP